MKTKIMSITIFLFLLSVVSFAQTANVDSLFSAAQEHHTKGIALIKSGDKKAGLKELIQSTEDFRDFKSWLYEKKDSLKEIFESLLKKEANSPVYNFMVGNWIATFQRDSVGLVKAKEFYEKAINIEPEYVLAYVSLASLAQQQGDNEETIK